MLTKLMCQFVIGWCKSITSENIEPKRQKTSKNISPFQTSVLSDITNVVGNDSLVPRHRHRTQIGTQLLHDSRRALFLDLTDDSLVENKISYNSDVLMELCTNNKDLQSTQPIVTSSLSIVDDMSIGKEKIKRPYRRRKIAGENQSDPILIDIDKPKRPYVRKSNVSTICNDEFVATGASSGSVRVSKSSSSNAIPTYMPRKYISRRSSRTSNAIDINEQLTNNVSLPSEYWDIGDASYECRFCHAEFWSDESSNYRCTMTYPYYSGCCGGGIIDLPRLVEPPALLRDLMHGTSSRSKHFQENIRSYNSMFCFTSMGGKIDHDINRGTGPPIFRMHGQNYHLIGSLLPENGATPKFAQMYIYDTENEVSHRKNSVRGTCDKNNLSEDIILGLKNMLDENNKLVMTFRMAKDKIQESGDSNVMIRLIGKRSNNKDERTRDLPTCSEVAVLIVGDFDSALGERDIMVELRSGALRRINELNVSYLALQYPLLLPYGEDGYTEDIPFTDLKKRVENGRKTVSVREYFVFRLHDRKDEASTILSSRRLFQQFIVDAYTMVETGRLKYVYCNQKKFRCDIYRGLADAVVSGENDPKSRGKRIILPSSFTGGTRFMIQNYQDAMAICRSVGYPDLFITFTCNPSWPEIIRFLDSRNLRAEDRPDIVCRVFKIKLNELIREMRKDQIFGKVVAVVYTIEFQKRGLPHAHILLFLAKENKYPTPKDIDRIISAEIPDEKSDPTYYEAVKTHMMHGPCGLVRKNSPCMVEGKCTKHFPKKYTDDTVIDDEGYPHYRRRDSGRTIDKGGAPLDNRYVVPHNRRLLMKFGAHINVEWCNQSRSIKYLFKYVNKGHDRVTAAFYQNKDSGEADKPIDEVSMYYDCRYISSCEAAWRLLEFELQYKYPPVTRLNFHLENEQNIIYEEDENIEDVLNKPTVQMSMFLEWMKANKKYEDARLLTYPEAPSRFVWDRKAKEWKPRQKVPCIGRLYYVPPGCGDNYYLRCLLTVVRGATCYADYMKYNNVQYESYRDACYARGLLGDDREYIDGIAEASEWASARSLRSLFVSLLSADTLSKPEEVWNSSWQHLSDDVLHKQRMIFQNLGLQLTELEIKNLTLIEIEKLLKRQGKSLLDYESMPFPENDGAGVGHSRLIQDELNYDRKTMSLEHTRLLSNMTNEQNGLYFKIMSVVKSGGGGVFFVYGYGGTGKTYLWRTLSAGLRSEGHIVLNVASSGIASLLLPGGRTAHSRFGIPLNPHEGSDCNIRKGTPLAELIIRCKLIIWDEAPMMHKHCFEAVNNSLQDIMEDIDPANKGKPFGGKTVVFGGDFRQILPVIPKGSRQDIVNATINSSFLWRECTVLRLTQNMRLHSLGNQDERAALKEFSEWIANIGDGNIGGANDGSAVVEIPEEILIKYSDDPIAAIVDDTYPMFRDSIDDPMFLKDRAILAPTIEVVNSINEYMNGLNSSEGYTYLSSDSTCKSDGSTNDFLSDLHTPEFLNGIKCSGVPNHELHLKVGTPVMLLRNLDHSMGLCNGTRLVVTKLSTHVIECKILTGAKAGEKVLLPRLNLTPSDTRIPFKFQRRQFPIMISYAMTINKSQGQSLSNVGLFLKNPVFSHGQLYVAVSRVTNRKGLRILVCDDDESMLNKTNNVVYKEVFSNI
ncbi:hypothetical protein CASFOL_032457 [Castilleja foliolosa]|uniref:ATP-dependent DNA helicase n=1 Tax=Castilleja foliolosa TaxID=1961234 RepID=A0ABD3C2M6_9LAMI